MAVPASDLRMLPHHRYLSPAEALHRAVPSAIGFCETCGLYCDGDEDPNGFSCTCCDYRGTEG